MKVLMLLQLPSKIAYPGKFWFTSYLSLSISLEGINQFVINFLRVLHGGSHQEKVASLQFGQACPSMSKLAKTSQTVWPSG